MKTQPAIFFSICTALLAGCSPVTNLNREIAAIDAQLEKLPKLQPNMLCPTVGFGSALVPEPDHTTWLDIILPEPQQLDTIVLIPALLKNKNGNLETFGFPQRFTIETWLDETPELQKSDKNQVIPGWHKSSHKWSVTHQGTHWAEAGYNKGRVVVDYSQQDFPNPGTAPVVFSLPPGTRAKKVRIRATHLQQEMSWRQNKKIYNFAINEVLLFDKMQNVALNCQVASADAENFPLMFRSVYAVDGYSYFPPIDPRKVSSPEQESIEEAPALFFDLGRTCTLNEIRLYPVDRSPQFSHIYAMGIGFPHNITLRISNQPDQNTARSVLNITTVHQIGSAPLMLRLKKNSGRYVWLEMSKGQYDPRTGEDALGLSEIQLLQNGTNVLAGIQPLLPAKTQDKLRHLTDGLTSSGIIMPQKEWLLKLQRRAMLEQEKARLLLQQEHWVEKQRSLMRYLKGALLAVLLAAVFIALLIRSRHRHNLRQLREKIGANLHDEVGANLSSIAISSELLKHVDQLNSHQARQLIDDITRVAQETATEIRLLSRFLEKQGGESNLIGQLRHIEQQMLTGLHSRADLGAPEQFNALIPTDKWELVLFFKEALNNIFKHAQATRVRICTRADAKQLYLEISDNGQGLPEDRTPPVHLAKRAKKLHAQLEISSSKNEGTTLRLCIPKKRRQKK